MNVIIRPCFSHFFVDEHTGTHKVGALVSFNHKFSHVCLVDSIMILYSALLCTSVFHRKNKPDRGRKRECFAATVPPEAI